MRGYRRSMAEIPSGLRPSKKSNFNLVCLQTKPLKPRIWRCVASHRLTAEIHLGLWDFRPSTTLTLWDFDNFNTEGSASTCLLALDGSDHFGSLGLDLRELGMFLISKLPKKNSRSDGSDDAWLLDSDDRDPFRDL
jgi:hypothetical protein